MADDAARSLLIDVDWDIEADSLSKATEESDKLKTNAEDIIKTTKKSAKQVNTSAQQMTKDYKKTGGAAGDTADEVEGIGTEAEESEKKVSKLGNTMSSVAKAAAAGFAAVGAAVIAIGKKALDAGKLQQEYEKSIAVGTGATGEQLDGILDSFEKVGKNSTQALGDVATGIANVNTLLGYEGELLEGFTDKNLKLQQITGESIDGLTVATSNLVNRWDIAEDQVESTLDSLLVVSQATNVPITTLAETVGQYSNELQLLGFDLQTSTALLGNWQKEGYDAATMLQGLNTAQKKMVAEGITDMAEGLDIAIEKIKSAATEEEAFTLATEAFGANAAADFSTAIRSGVLDVDDLVRAMQDAEGAIDDTARATETFDEKWQRAQNQIHFALAEIGGPLLDIFSDLVDDIVPLIEPIGELFTGLFQEITPAIQGLVSKVGPIIEQVSTILADIGPPIIEAIVDIVDALVPVVDIALDLATDLLPVIANVISNIVPVIGRLIKSFQPLISKILPPLVNLIELGTEVFFSLIDPILDIVDAVLPPLIDILTVVLDTILPPLISVFSTLIREILPQFMPVISSIIESLEPFITILLEMAQVVLPIVADVVGFLAKILVDQLGKAFDTIGVLVTVVTGVFSGLIDFITSVFTGDWEGAWTAVVGIFGTIFEGIAQLFKTPINWIIENLNKFLSGLSNIKIPDWVPLVGGKGFDIKPIPLLAEGAENFPGGAAIVGELGPELVELPRGSNVIPAAETKEILSNTQIASDTSALTGGYDGPGSGGGDTYIEVTMQFEVDASGADDSAVERLRTELRAEMPRAIEQAFKVLFLKNKPA